MIAAGRLDQAIEIVQTARVADSAGSTVESDEPFPVRAWANVRQQGGAERQRNGITTAANTFAIRIRWRESETVRGQPFVDTSATVLYRGRCLEILSVTEGGMNNREWIDLVAAEAK